MTCTGWSRDPAWKISQRDRGVMAIEIQIIDLAIGVIRVKVLKRVVRNGKDITTDLWIMQATKIRQGVDSSFW